MALFSSFGSESSTESDVRLTDQRNTADNQSVQDNTRIAANAVGQGSTQIRTGGGALTISSDPQVVHDAIAAVRDQSGAFAESLTAIFAASSDAQSAQAIGNALSQKTLLENTFTKLTDLAKGQQSDGDTDRNKIVLYVSLAALVVVGAAFLFRK